MTNYKSILALFLLSTSLVFSQDYDFNVNSIPEELLENANAVVRFDNVSIEIASQRQQIVNIEKAITIFNDNADSFADITLFYNKRTSINGIKTYVYDRHGKEIKKIKKSDFRDYSATSGNTLISDSRVLYYDHTPISYPFTIYYKYQIKTSNTAFIRDWIYMGGYNFSIQKDNYSIKYPTDFILNKSEENFEGYDVEKTEKPGFLSYKTKNVGAFKREPNTPSLINFLPYVKLGLNKFNLEGVDGEASNWKEFGKWYYHNLVKSTLDLPESTKSKIIELTSTTEDPVEKAKIVYKFVQDKTRYISVQVGIGGFKPMLATDVDRLGYGDCKGLTNYTAALLNTIGIDAYHTLIYAQRKRNLNSKVASVQGNHMILYVLIDENEYWLECTSKEHPFAEVGGFTDDRDALVVTPEGGDLKHTKIYKPNDNKQLTNGKYSIDKDGTISASVTINSNGTQYDNHLFSYKGKKGKDLDVEFKEYFSNINNIKFTKIETFNNKEDAVFEEDLEFTATDYASKSGNQLLIPINAFNKFSNVPKRIRNRKLPFEIYRGYVDIDEVEIELPASMEIEYIPEKMEITSKFGSYSAEISKIEDNKYLYKRKMHIEDGNYEKEEYDLYRKFIKSINKHDNSKIILKNK